MNKNCCHSCPLALVDSEWNFKNNFNSNKTLGSYLKKFRNLERWANEKIPLFVLVSGSLTFFERWTGFWLAEICVKNTWKGTAITIPGVRKLFNAKYIFPPLLDAFTTCCLIFSIKKKMYTKAGAQLHMRMNINLWLSDLDL